VNDVPASNGRSIREVRQSKVGEFEVIFTIDDRKEDILRAYVSMNDIHVVYGFDALIDLFNEIAGIC
jgi:hypothetical protein